jgi:aryl-alcohol dehydrogenase-like predicted oxidoreductase
MLALGMGDPDWGMSNATAWYVAKLATLSSVRGVPGPIALQYFYSLVNRDIEGEHVPLAKEFGTAIAACATDISPLAEAAWRAMPCPRRS